MEILRIKEEILAIGPDVVFNLGSFPVANSFLAILFLLIVFIIFSFIISRFFTLRPIKGQVVVEVVYEGMQDLVKQITGETKYLTKIFPLIAALFVYLTCANLLGIVPGLTSLTYNGVSIFRVPTTDFNTTFGLAAGMVLMTQVINIKEWGMFGYFGRFLQFKEVFLGFKTGLGAGLVAFIGFLVGLLDIVSEFAKVISLSLRLFGNIYAGEILAIIALGFMSFVFPSAIMVLSIFFGIIQAMVFGSLVAAYYMSVVNPELEEVDEGAQLESELQLKTN